MILNYGGVEYELNETYSEKDMTGWDLSDRTDMSGAVIHGLCLSHEKINSRALPVDLTGATFIACNLDNVLIPSGNELIDCSTRRFKALEDGRDWLLDENDNPVEPL